MPATVTRPGFVWQPGDIVDLAALERVRGVWAADGARGDARVWLPGALARAREQEFAAVLSDYRMPGMNGIEFLETVARRHPSSVRILLSGYVDQSEIEYAITSGTVHHFIKKPWDLTRLVSLVCKALDTSESDDTEPLHPPMFMPHQTFLPA